MGEGHTVLLASSHRWEGAGASCPFRLLCAGSGVLFPWPLFLLQCWSFITSVYIAAVQVACPFVISLPLTQLG